MLHIKILYIPNVEKLIYLIQKSCGQVLFLCPGHALYDLSQENADMELLKEEIRKGKDLTYSFPIKMTISDLSIIWYMLVMSEYEPIFGSKQNGGKNVSRLSCAYRV